MVRKKFNGINIQGVTNLSNYCR